MKTKTFLTIFLGLAFIISSCNSGNKTFYKPEESPETVGKKIIKDLLSKKKFRQINKEKYWGIHYAEACAGYGAIKLAGALNDKATVNIIKNKYSKGFFDSIPNSGTHVDVNVYGILPLEIYLQTHDKRFLHQGLKLADTQWDSTILNGLTYQTRFWIDDIWMIGSLQVQAYRVTKNMVYLNRAAHELSAYVEKLQQENGLFYHGEDAPFHWGRGNGWVAAGLAELLCELPESHDNYQTILTGYTKMMAALLTYQAEDGMWRQLIDKEISWKETSSTAMFGYAMTLGIKNGFLTGNEYKKASEKAWLALTTYVDSNGRVTEVCKGTSKSDEIEYYLERPRITGDLHGQAPVLWFAYSLQQSEKTE